MSKNSNEPRSIRLNKDHRADMLNAVMEQWEKANPPPAGARFEDFIKETLQALMKVPAKAPVEQKALKQLIQRTKDAIAFKATMPDTLKDHLEIKQEADFLLEVVLADGSVGANYQFKLPVAMADALKIPYTCTGEANGRYHQELQSYLTPSERYGDEGELEFVYLVNALAYNALVVPHDFKPLQQYRRTQRALNLWEQEKKKVREEIQDYLNQFSTTGQLRDGWPEMEQYLPAHIADPAKVIKLPALTRSRLNERLGLK